MQRRFRVRDKFIREISCQSAGKWRHPLNTWCLVFFQNLLNEILRTGCLYAHRCPRTNLHLSVPAAYPQLRVVSDKGVTSPIVAVFHTFKNITVRTNISHDSKHFHRCPHICIHFIGHRNHFIGSPVGKDFLQCHHIDVLLNTKKSVHDKCDLSRTDFIRGATLNSERKPLCSRRNTNIFPATYVCLHVRGYSASAFHPALSGPFNELR